MERLTPLVIKDDTGRSLTIGAELTSIEATACVTLRTRQGASIHIWLTPAARQAIADHLENLETRATVVQKAASQPAMPPEPLTLDPGETLAGNADAATWAHQFMLRFPDQNMEPDEGTMLGWFANAIEAGRMAAERERPTKDKPEIIYAFDGARLTDTAKRRAETMLEMIEAGFLKSTGTDGLLRACQFITGRAVTERKP